MLKYKNAHFSRLAYYPLLLLMVFLLVGSVLYFRGKTADRVLAQVNTAMPQFTDVAPGLGINTLGTGYGPNPEDYNSDGRVDFLFLNHLNPLNLFVQQPDGTFNDIAASSGITFQGDDHGSAWGDCDNDGRLDLYLSLGDAQSNRLYRQNTNGTFTNISAQSGADDNGRGRAAAWLDFDNDGDLDIYSTNRSGSEGRKDKLYRNDGNCSFADVSLTAGNIASSYHQTGIAAADYDNDGDTDVFASARSPEGATGDLFRNNANGSFSDVTTSSGIINESNNAAVWGDYDNDGDLDLFVTRSGNGVSNRLYRNNGNASFTEVAGQAGVASSLDSYDAVWADFNNDGYLDLYVANAGRASTGNRPNFLYQNNKNGTFTEVASMSGVQGASGGQSGNVAVMDYNSDGFMDFVLTHGLTSFSLDGPHEVFRNGGNDGKWLEVKLQGVQSNSFGLGAKAVATTDTGLEMTRQLTNSTHGYSQDQMLAHFGLADSASVSLTIYWPSGIVQSIDQITPNQMIQVTESDTVNPTPTTSVPPTFTPTPVFSPTPTQAPITPTLTQAPAEVIIDNTSGEFTTTGFWNTSSNSQFPFYGTNFRYAPKGSGSKKATFAPNLTQAGNYEVFVWYFTKTTSGTNVPHAITYNGGTTTILVNRRGAVGGGYWYSLGVYPFLSGTSGKVVVSDNADGYVEADAVRFVSRQ